ncbi:MULTISPECIES: YetF domain-containing protein [unclassified Sporolactobacillus]|uniref:YetF domain-containing protein n=1 Tax=unclassified Sporolactobacillus TaxID=2628533 RepID=UPI002368D937|nr:YetF domain-containing protein [Sporolactobacillus sp. CQH2019]MDD9147672.1 hypothetical protein [Sporolactobacillus sp. CQH2019]
MGTAAARTLLLIIIMLFGFRDLMAAKLGDRTFSEFMMLLAAVELSFFAVIRPDEPLIPFLIPLLLLIAAYRLYVFLFEAFTKRAIRESIASLSLKEESRPPRRVRPPSAAGKPAFPGSAGPPMGLPLIECGKVRGDNLKRIGKTYLWLRQELRKFGYRDIRRVNYLTIDQAGNFYMDMKDGKSGN